MKHEFSLFLFEKEKEKIPSRPGGGHGNPIYVCL
jgi:hypothetical protein